MPFDYTRNVCKYRDLPRFYYSAMVSAMNDAVDQVIGAFQLLCFYYSAMVSAMDDAVDQVIRAYQLLCF